MICRKLEESLIIFEKRSGMRAVFAGNEMQKLLYAIERGTKTEFIKRLLEKEILPDFSEKTRNLILEAAKSQNNKTKELEAIHIELTTQCPFSCKQCYQNMQNEMLSLHQVKALLREAEQLKVFQIAIGGGEPMIYPYLKEVLTMLQQTEMAVTITSSGYGMTKEKLKELKSYGVNHIQISLNGVDKQMQEQSRQGYEEAVLALKNLSESDISFGINFVARKDNIEQLEKIILFAQKLHADNVNILRYKPSKHERYEEIALNEEEHKWLANKIISLKQEGVQTKIKIDSAYAMLYWYIYQGKTMNQYYGCQAGRKFIAITAKGTFKVCSHYKIEEEGNSIENWLNTSETVKKLEKKTTRIAQCSTCIYQKKCCSCSVIPDSKCIAYKRMK